MRCAQLANISLTWVVGSLLCACAEDRQHNPLELSVEKLITITGDQHTGETCYVPCRGSNAPSAVLEQTCESLELDASEVEANRDCGFVAGDGRIRVSVRYNVRVPVREPLASPTLELITDQGALAQRLSFDLRKEEIKGKSYPVAVASLSTPVTSTSGLGFRVTVANDVVIDSTSHSQRYSIDTSKPQLRIQECPQPDDCRLPSGIGTVTVELVAAQGFTGTMATLSTSLGGITQLGTPIAPLTLSTVAGKARAQRALAVPSAAGRVWTIDALLDGQQVSAQALLVAPAQPALKLKLPSGGEIDPAKPLRRALSEPNAACRTYLVDVEARDVAAGGMVSLQASAGSFEGAATSILLTPDTAGKAQATLLLPNPVLSPAVSVELGVDTSRKRSVTLRLADVLPLRGSGTLAAASRELTLGAEGTPSGVALRGSVATVPGALFGVTSRVWIKTRATSAAAAPVPCGKPALAAAVSCDPLAQGAAAGGCFLVPATASLDATGHFSVPINPGICFAGSVEISVWSKAYPADAVAEDCVGELVESDAIELSSVVLTFAPASPGG